MSLTLRQYQELALVTKPTSTSLTEDIQHSGFGLVTEIGEIVDAYKRQKFYGKPLDKVNLLEEIGDVLWYLVVGLYGLENGQPTEVTDIEDLGDISPLTTGFLLGRLSHYSSNVLLYSSGFDDQQAYENYLMQDFKLVLTLLRVLCVKEDLDWEKAKELNIAKLKARFPTGFTQHEALNRNLLEERKVLEDDTQSNS